MGFNFSYICDLLSSLDANRIIKATTTGRSKDPDVTTVTAWFRLHEQRIHGGDTDYLALLSCLFPELRPDRVYGFKEPSLVKIIGRCLLLGTSRWQELECWKAPGRGDLGECVERVMGDAENELFPCLPVTVEEIDAALNKIAAKCRFSAPDVRRQRTAVQVDEALNPIFRRLNSRDAKWFTRLLLREYTPVVIPQRLALRKFHFMLPAFLSVQSTLKGALEAMDRGPVKKFPSCPDAEYARTLMELSIPHLAPQIGIKVGRPEYYKARNLRHCCRMADKRLMSIERKYDGEYCQIHIDLENGPQYIRIFSKSGKDSTVDRKGIHEAIRDSLRIRRPGCRFSKRCILEGELLVWSDIKHDILPFHHLRKHIMRAGAFIGTENDSP
ncbi:putative DNA ligase (ATP) [Microsporum canis]